jgi:erythromycin esterase
MSKTVEDPPKEDPQLELGPGLFELTSRSIDGNYADLRPLTEMLSDARYLAIGEAYHGSDGLHDMQNRLFAYAIEELGVRAIGMESSDALLVETNDYIETCEGNPRRIVAKYGNSAGMGVVRLLEYLCQFNSEHPDNKVELYGFDIWNGPEDYQLLASQLSQEITTDLASCYGVDAESTWDFYSSGRAPQTEEANASCLAGVEAGLALEPLTLEQEIALRRLYGWENFWALNHLNNGADAEEGSRIRDEVMAFLATTIADRDFAGERIVLFGHNAHMAKRFEETERITGPYNHVRMGSHLREELGDDYFVAAMTAYDASIKTLNYEGPINRPTADHAVESIIHFDFEVDFALADFQHSGDAVFAVGETYQVGHIEMVASDQFDALVFMDKAEAQVTP